MGDTLFRKKSLDKIKSPEALNDYVQVTSPGVWLLLAAAVALLVGALIWSVFGHAESRLSTSVVVENGIAVCTVADEIIEPDMPLRVDGKELTVLDVGYDNDTGRLLCTIRAEADGLADGVYDAELVLESVKPISFVVN